MFLIDSSGAPPALPTVVYSPTDLALAACPFQLLRTLDEKLGRLAPLEVEPDPMAERAKRLGDAHERRVLEGYLARYGVHDGARPGGVATIGSGGGSFREGLAPAQAETLAALRAGADVVFQGSFFDGRFHGRADFLVKVPQGPGGGTSAAAAYAVVDTKLTASVRSSALLQLAAYADQLLALGIEVSDQVWIHHGDGERSPHVLADIIEVYREERRIVEALLDAHVAWGQSASWEEWRDPAGVPAETELLPPGVALARRACGVCAHCAAEVERTRDVQLVHGIRATQRARLYSAGVRTIAELAALATSPRRIPHLNPAVQGRLVRQGAAQLGQLERIDRAREAGFELGAGMRVVAADGAPLAEHERAQAASFEPIVRAEVIEPAILAALPPADPGDIYFDFEGDPMWTTTGGLEGGLEYLFGLVEEGEDERYRAFWAHDRAQEKQALLDFLGYVAQRRERHPGMRIYHYASYERSALERLAERHGVGLEEVLGLMREGVLVDLHPIVRNAVTVSQASYSIKKLEPLYMGNELRDTSGVVGGADSVVAYAAAAQALAEGRPGAQDAWQRTLEQLADYNRYDCVSTRRLLQWLRALGRAGGSSPAPTGRVSEAAADRSGAPWEPERAAPLALAPTGEQRLESLLLDAAGERPREAGHQALALLASAIDFHRREAAPAWRAHFERLTYPIDWWAETRDVLAVDHHLGVLGGQRAGTLPPGVEIRQPWTPGPRGYSRVLRVEGTLGPGSTPAEDRDVYCVYPLAVAHGLRTEPGAAYATTNARLLSFVVAQDGTRATFEVRETAQAPFATGTGAGAYPVAVVPGAPVRTDGPHAAIVSVAERVAGTSVAALDALPPGAPTPSCAVSLPRAGQVIADLLTRRAPRLVGSGPLPGAADGEDLVAAVTEATAALDDSVLAVQGPPGTGKTYVGARVVANLVRHLGWRVGVVAQSHAVVEHLLDAIVATGLPGSRVGKRPGRPLDLSDPEISPPGWTVLAHNAHASFLQQGRQGCVIGGTVWDFTNRKRVAEGELDLLVVDEAGQFSLANTMAAATSARRLLLLGDPQQLPQVTQGVHAEPVDIAALAWIADGAATLPPERGYFLPRSWRMRSELCKVVSELSYAGRLLPRTECTDARSVVALTPGVHVRAITHHGNSSASIEEAREVTRIVSSLMGTLWVPDSGEPPRPMEPRDVLVVAPYNAQVTLVEAELASAGWAGVRVGTVDRFQGQEAAVVVLTLAASSAQDVPRGLDFLLDRHRLNVSLSRGKCAAVIVRSAALGSTLPTSGAALADLGAFLRVCASATSTTPTGLPSPDRAPRDPGTEDSARSDPGRSAAGRPCGCAP